MNTCGTCTSWRLDGPLGKLGYGLCSVQPNPMLAASLRTTKHNQCLIGRFKAKKQCEATLVPDSRLDATQAPSRPLPEPFEREEPIDPERLAKLGYGGSD